MQAELDVAELSISMEYGVEDFLDRLLLEDANVLATVHESDPGASDGHVCCEPAVGAGVLEIRDIALEITFLRAGGCVSELQGDRDRLADQLLELDVGVLRCELEIDFEQLAERFVAVELGQYELGTAGKRCRNRE
ncbi:hypothetical protein WJ12_00050 [Burkholderia seminalis]|nr:hypothetical protein WJ12_00050 [Burkholderia seminalis]KVF43315.1 hypothetical protein WJ13_00950 [Burkholderia seminalis]